MVLKVINNVERETDFHSLKKKNKHNYSCTLSYVNKVEVVL